MKQNTSMNGAVDHLRSCIIGMRTAAKAEQIDPEGPLGVWVQAQEAMLLSMAHFAELQTDRLVETVTAVDRAMTAAVTLVEAEVQRVRATNETARVETMRLRSQGDVLKEERLKAGDDLAIRMSDKIQDHLKHVILIRERRWNLFHQLKLVGIFAGVLFATYLGGQWMVFHGDRRGILEQCRLNPAIDPITKISYCPIWMIEGLPDPMPPPLANRR